MTREIVLDTETTGLDPRDGHRVIEIGCVELRDFLPTGETFHRLIDPERDIDDAAERVHGLSRAFLAGRSRFADPEVAAALVAFIGDAPVIAHNAGFDRGFINHELALAGHPMVSEERWIDTLALAQKRFPGMYNSLDALCKRFRISLAEREKHGALVDAQLLAAVYLELRGGRERRLDLAPRAAAALAGSASPAVRRSRPRPLAPRLTSAERAAHRALVTRGLGEGALWLRLSPYAGGEAAPSGVAEDLALGLGLAGEVDGREVDGFEQERGEPALG